MSRGISSSLCYELFFISYFWKVEYISNQKLAELYTLAEFGLGGLTESTSVACVRVCPHDAGLVLDFKKRQELYI